MIRFDDDVVNICKFACVLAKLLANEIMNAYAEEACAEGSRRYDYRERDLVNNVGT